MEIPVEFPVDADGFLRRMCQSCGQEFKWHNGPTELRPPDAADPLMFACPLCGSRASPEDWQTEGQGTYLREVGEFHMQDVVNGEMKKVFGKNYRPGKNTASAPTALHEPNDMIIIEPPCHPWEPVKVPEERADSGPMFCLVCGESYSA
ncbi:MAG: hypothetical protein AB7G47_21330 [Mycolicibacterium sp.]|uniref:hypothetical protein n=1 Tax=Mycolicibacterium sp. TaxID=2320850 RepID=UPI003D0C6CD2